MNWKSVRQSLPHVFGLLGLAMIVAGVWGKWGWEWAAMIAGAVPSGFYLYGEIRRARSFASDPLEEGE